MPSTPALFLLAALLPPQDPAPAAARPAAPAAAPAAAQPAIEWQRSLDDALAVQRATGRPLLLCVNIDGEVFCERFANETYRDPAFIAATRGHVCLIAAPDRHNEFDYDFEGKRIECPRFPGVTCGEHVAVEPRLFEKYFGGRRAAPRHMGISAAGEVLFDHILESSMQPAIDSVRRHAAPGSELPLPATAADLLRRRDAASRAAVEAAFRNAGASARIVLLEAAAAAPSEPFDLLRMGLRSEDERAFAAAARALCATATGNAVIDLQDALARAEDSGLRHLLLAAIDRLAGTEPSAQRLRLKLGAVADDQGLAGREPWRSAAGRAPSAPAAETRAQIEERLDALERRLKQRPDDDDGRLELARSYLALGELLAADADRGAALYLEDAVRSAAKVGKPALRATAACIEAWAGLQLGRREEARAKGREAVQALTESGNAEAAAGLLAARALEALAKGAAAAAYGVAEADFGEAAAEALRESAQAFAALTAHPHGTETHALDRAGLLEFAGDRSRARRLLEEAVRRFPASAAAHERFRNRVLVDLGAEALRARYRAIAAEAGEATAEWFAAYAALVAAEQHVRDKRAALARAAYDESLERWKRSADGNAAYSDSANHFAVLALAGRALLKHEARDAQGAVDDLLAARERRATSMQELDGLGRKPQAILERIARELREKGNEEQAARLGG